MLHDDNAIFRFFIRTMNDILEENEEVDGRNQRVLLEDLFRLEDDFRITLISEPQGKVIYSDFVNFIKNEKGNILSARIYFRERQDIFSSKISNSFKTDKAYLLYRFKINYNFAKWVCDRYKGPKAKRLGIIYKKIIDIRKVLCENNIPLAINRAKIFWSKTPSSHLEYMDFIQNANEGLMNAIDKFVPPYKTVFRSVAIGRMTLNMLTDHNATVVKMSPTEKRILYRANNARVKAKLTDIDDVLEYVQQSFKNVTKEKLESILSSATGVASLDKESDDESVSLKDTMEFDGPDPEQSLITRESTYNVHKALKSTPMLEMKIIKMKFGVELDD
jgi:DNA-directed RNA polymerase specialized sigma subunit